MKNLPYVKASIQTPNPKRSFFYHHASVRWGNFVNTHWTNRYVWKVRETRANHQEGYSI